MELNDGSSIRNLQVVWPNGSASIKTTAPTSVAELKSPQQHLTTGASVRVSGKLVKSPKPGQAVELLAESVTILGGADPEHYPLQKKGHTVEFLRDIVHLRARGNLAAAVLRARDTLQHGIQSHLRKEGYIQVHTPVLTSNDCEGAGELFQVMPASDLAAAASGAGQATAQPPPKSAAQHTGQHQHRTALDSASSSFFNKPVYLTVSGQLHLETFACAMQKVYTFGPTFRAENSNTSRHLAEFWMLEPELCPGNMHDAMMMAQGCVKAACAQLLNDRPDDVAFFNDRVMKGVADRLSSTAAVDKPFAVMTYGQAIDALSSCGHAFTTPVSWHDGLASEHERYLAEVHCKGPVFVTDYPAHQKPFYMKTNDDGDDGACSSCGGVASHTSACEPGARRRGQTAQAFDLLVPGVGELIGGSAREDRYEVLGRKMKRLGLLSEQAAAALDAPDGGLSSPPANPDGRCLDWYLDLRKYGSIPHAGFGLGFERLLLLATGVENVRDAIPVPRVPGSCRM